MSATIVREKEKDLVKCQAFSDQQIRQIADGDAASIAQWALTTAEERGIRVRSRPNDEWIRAVSRLSDGVVDLDPVEELLVELSLAARA